MAKQETPDLDLALELGRTLTAKIAPEELDFYFELVSSSAKRRPPQADHPIGFGLGEGAVGLVAVAMYSVAQTLLQMLWEAAKPSLVELTKEGAEDLRKLLAERFRNWVQSGFSDPPPLAIAEDVQDDLVAMACKEAANRGVQSADVEKLRATLKRALG